MTNNFTSTAQEILFFPRAVAIIIDAVLISFVNTILISIVPVLYATLGPLISIGIWIGYNGLMFAGKWQATLGKRLMGVYVTTETGGKPDMKTSLLRAAMLYVSALILGIGFLLAFFRPDRKTLHDLVAKTRVVQGKVGEGFI